MKHVGALFLLGQDCDLDVLEDSEPREYIGDLKRSRDAAAANRVRRQSANLLVRKQHPAVVGLELTANEIEQGCLAGAIRSDYGDDRVIGHREADTVQRLEFIE